MLASKHERVNYTLAACNDNNDIRLRGLH